VFPESLSAAADGSLYMGSWKGIVYRALHGQTKATPWIRPSAENGLLSILGVMKNGAAYISDTPNGRIFRVSRGSKQLELFAQGEQLKGIDGTVFSGDGTLYANSVTTNKLWRIAIGKDGIEADAL
jgi:sugar lactone lactonase YvrE